MKLRRAPFGQKVEDFFFTETFFGLIRDSPDLTLPNKRHNFIHIRSRQRLLYSTLLWSKLPRRRLRGRGCQLQGRVQRQQGHLRVLRLRRQPGVRIQYVEWLFFWII